MREMKEHFWTFLSLLNSRTVGSPFYLPNNHPLVIEDCTVVYARSKFHHNAGGSVFSLRGKGQGSGGFTITFRNIAVEDPRPTHMHFKIMMKALPPWGNPDDRTRGPGDIYGITFQEKYRELYVAMCIKTLFTSILNCPTMPCPVLDIAAFQEHQHSGPWEGWTAGE